MSVIKNYLKYLDIFEKTSSISDSYKAKCALRHDVDYSLDAALEMAFFENYYGFAATYFILPYAPYWNDPKLITKILQIQDFGHEIGIHFNGIADWMAKRTSNIETDFDQILSFLRSNKIKIHGISAHGDSLCYKYNFINYWAFSNLKPNNPFENENNRTAEGVIDISLDQKKISYPSCEFLKRDDGSIFNLWSIDFKKYNINYDAWHTDFDKYYSDSGGSWKRSPDPLNVKCFNNYKSQVLIHPEYWIDKPKIYFFLGSARSGSTWLTNILNTSTNINARHEYIFNQDFYNKIFKSKNTHNVSKLENNFKLRESSLLSAWEEFSKFKKSYAEVNIYLENFIYDVKKIFRNSEYIYLQRDKKKIITSVLNRDWYLSDKDIKRPNIIKCLDFIVKKLNLKIDNKNKQFLSILAYLMQVKKNLNNQCHNIIDIDKAFKNMKYLEKKLYENDIYFYPRLALVEYNKIINRNSIIKIKSPNFWPKNYKYIYDKFNNLYNNQDFHLESKNVKKVTYKFYCKSNKIINKFFTRIILNNKFHYLSIFLKFLNFNRDKLLKINNKYPSVTFEIKVNKKFNSTTPIFIQEYTSFLFFIRYKIYNRKILLLNSQKKIYTTTIEFHPKAKYFVLYPGSILNNNKLIFKTISYE